MSSAEQHIDDPEQLFVADLTRVIITLLANRGLTATDVCEHLGCSRGTWYNRMHDGRWTGWQLAQIADLFEVDVADLYGGADEIVPRRQKAKYLTLVDDDGGADPEAGEGWDEHVEEATAPGGRHLVLVSAGD